MYKFRKSSVYPYMQLLIFGTSQGNSIYFIKNKANLTIRKKLWTHTICLHTQYKNTKNKQYIWKSASYHKF